MRYRDAGVDIAKADATLSGLKAVIRSTFTPHVKGDVGHFAGLAPAGRRTGCPLGAGTDGVGTKILIARHEALGGRAGTSSAIA
jgi:phosphoribosylaminoimidazole (AIR) synthetase